MRSNIRSNTCDSEVEIRLLLEELLKKLDLRSDTMFPAATDFSMTICP
jgi:hypothetical protein